MNPLSSNNPFLDEVIKARGKRDFNLFTSTYPVFVNSRFKLDPEADIYEFIHATLGASGEVGELTDAVKKTWVYNKELDPIHVLEEVGDIYFYLQKMLSKLGWTMEDAAVYNMAKLRARYPDGYSDAAAKARADKQITGETE